MDLDQSSPESTPPPRVLHPRLYLGTSAWSNRDWTGLVYPEGTTPRDYLRHYARRFRAVEADSTWYGPPSRPTTTRWRSVLPAGFVFAAKAPRTITHDKILVDCEGDLDAFLEAMEPLGSMLGPILFQFPYFGRDSGMSDAEFLRRLRAFLPRLPRDGRFAVEIRNKNWLEPRLLEPLRIHGVALTLIDHPWMTPIARLVERLDPVTAPFVYVRWLGDRHGIERMTRTWDRVIVDRSEETREWVGAIGELLERHVTVYGFFNNHYAGHAPGSIALFERLWGAIREPGSDPA